MQTTKINLTITSPEVADKLREFVRALMSFSLSDGSNITNVSWRYDEHHLDNDYPFGATVEIKTV